MAITKNMPVRTISMILLIPIHKYKLLITKYTLTPYTLSSYNLNI